MNIVHICLCGPYTDGWGYQDNKFSELDQIEPLDNFCKIAKTITSFEFIEKIPLT